MYPISDIRCQISEDRRQMAEDKNLNAPRQLKFDLFLLSSVFCPLTSGAR
jgi:hypothetical protein